MEEYWHQLQNIHSHGTFAIELIVNSGHITRKYELNGSIVMQRNIIGGILASAAEHTFSWDFCDRVNSLRRQRIRMKQLKVNSITQI